jgi:hypothetical protein
MAVSKVELANGEVLMDLTGDSVTPDTLAEGETAHDATGEPIVGRMKSGGGASVQSDWNQNDETAADFIKNKPFGEFGGDTLTWVLDYSKIDVENLPGGYFVKVSDTIITMSDLSNGCVFDIFGEPFYVAPEEIMVLGDGVVTLPEMLAIFVDENGVGVEVEGIVFPESGIYVIVEFGTGYLTIPGFVEFIATKKMDSKYLPDSCATQIIFYETGGYLYKDTGFTEKVREAEILNVIQGKQNVAIHDPSKLCNSVFIGTCENYGFVVYYKQRADEDFELTKAYTAEYTPPTP